VVKENLDTTRGEHDARAQTLQHTQHVLEETQDSLVQQRVLLDAHIRAEQEFQAASGDITTLLAGSLKDVKGLHQRIGTMGFVWLFVCLVGCLFVCFFVFVVVVFCFCFFEIAFPLLQSDP
jgi:hypothetical protein